MKNTFLRFALVSLALGISSAHAQYANVVIGGEIRPGVYGRVLIGHVPPPLVYPKPIRIVRTRRHLKPVYLHVPPAHAGRWGRYCYKYRACHQPVYFVKSAEYDPGHRGGKGQAYAEARR
jgi:hypothetical protein